MTADTRPPQALERDATIEGVLRDWETLMRRSSNLHTPEFLAIDVTMSQAKLLHVVASEPEARMSSLAGRLGVSLSTLSGVVDRLVEHGFLERHEDPSDRRQVMIALTAEGRSVIERFRELGSRHFRALLETLEGDELTGLARGVSAMVARAQASQLDSPASPQATPMTASTAQEGTPA